MGERSNPLSETVIPPLAAEPTSMAAMPPLVVDLDGTLVRTDTLWEGVLHVASHRPLALLRILPRLLRGRAAFKAAVAQHAVPALEGLPLDERVLQLIEERRAGGQQIILVTGANIAVARTVGARIEADAVHGSETINLTGHRKLQHIRSFASTFDYVGNAAADLPLWASARQALAVNSGAMTRWRARRVRPDLVELAPPHFRWRDMVRALRPHQWIKNVLIVLPVVAAHTRWTLGLATTLLLGFASFSLAASAVYVVNDLCDAADDRQHHQKRHRPFASGRLSVGDGVGMAIALFGIAALIASRLPWGFGALLGVYVVFSTSYSLVLKRKLALDVIMLATLYTLRVVAGAALTRVPLSRWFLAFAVFFFLALAVAKRVIELRRLESATARAPGRRYNRGDLPVLYSLGAGATMASALVYCLYITSADVTLLYKRPDALWFGLLLLLYWQSRLWLMAARGEVNEDPVVFALRDPTSRLVLGAFVLVLAAALW